MKILFVTPEVAPFARAGGLGDVSRYLPQALAARGHQPWIITPKYRSADGEGRQLKPIGPELPVPLSWRSRTVRIHEAVEENGVKTFFVGCDDLYDRAGLYGNEFGDYEDNAERFIFFSRAVLELIRTLDLRPDVIHCHDWPSGLVPVYVKTLYKDMEQLKGTATVFTFHNLGSQGIFWHYDYAMTGLGWELFTPEGLEFHGQINLTKAGLIFADLVSTVSRKYAEEALLRDYAHGLEGVLRARQADTLAVPHGVDYQVWDPARDPNLVANYTADSLHLKKECRQDLCRAFDLTGDDRPIVAVVSRLLDRKGLDIIKAAVDRLLSLPLRMVFMGLGEDRYHVFLADLAAANPGRVSVKIAYEPGLVHRIMAGADIFLMPSRFEPCGLEQMYGLKYGTIPVVRATGGLDDTVVDMSTHPETGTGFKFHEYSAEALSTSLAAAVDLFRDGPAWASLQRRGMALDFSWDKAAAAYESLYDQARTKAARR